MLDDQLALSEAGSLHIEGFVPHPAAGMFRVLGTTDWRSPRGLSPACAATTAAICREQIDILRLLGILRLGR